MFNRKDAYRQLRRNLQPGKPKPPAWQQWGCLVLMVLFLLIWLVAQM